jgi:hypothetical protein
MKGLFQPSLMFVDKAMSLPSKVLNLVLSCLTQKTLDLAGMACQGKTI